MNKEHQIVEKDDISYVSVFNPKPTTPKEIEIAAHKLWLKTIRKEYPSPNKKFKIGVYIRFFNQTKYEDYLNRHKDDFTRTIGLCPNWTLIDFYVDYGASAPNMENAPEWCRLLQDCINGKVDLIITQKLSNVTSDLQEITILANYFALMNIGIYFISEDIFTLATYYQNDLKETRFFPSEDWEQLPPDNLDND